jgi:hypothetical protein
MTVEFNPKTKSLLALISLGIFCCAGCSSELGPRPTGHNPQSPTAKAQEQQELALIEKDIDNYFASNPSPFRQYEHDLLFAIEKRWYDLMDAQNVSKKARGKVTFAFTLHSDGSVSDVAPEEGTLDEPYKTLCEKAIVDVAPFPKWPDAMVSMLGDSRRLTFTFYYQ